LDYHKKWIFILSMHGRFFVRWLQIKGQGAERHHSNFSKGTGPWRVAIPEVTSIFLVCMHILLFGHLDDVWIQIWTTGIQIHFKLSRRNTRLEVWNPINHACQTRVHRPPWHTQRPPPTWPRFQVRAGCRMAPLQFSKVWGLKEWPYLKVH
jgi:hypothetical protein